MLFIAACAFFCTIFYLVSAKHPLPEAPEITPQGRAAAQALYDTWYEQWYGKMESFTYRDYIMLFKAIAKLEEVHGNLARFFLYDNRTDYFLTGLGKTESRKP